MRQFLSDATGGNLQEKKYPHRVLVRDTPAPEHPALPVAEEPQNQAATALGPSDARAHQSASRGKGCAVQAGRKVPRDATPIASGPRFSSMGFIPSAECQRARGRTSVRTWDKTRSIYVVLSSKRESVPRANRLSPRLVEGSRIKKERKSRQGQPWLNWVVRLRRRAYG